MLGKWPVIPDLGWYSTPSNLRPFSFILFFFRYRRSRRHPHQIRFHSLRYVLYRSWLLYVVWHKGNLGAYTLQCTADRHLPAWSSATKYCTVRRNSSLCHHHDQAGPASFFLRSRKQILNIISCQIRTRHASDERDPLCCMLHAAIIGGQASYAAAKVPSASQVLLDRLSIFFLGLYHTVLRSVALPAYAAPFNCVVMATAHMRRHSPGRGASAALGRTIDHLIFFVSSLRPLHCMCMTSDKGPFPASISFCWALDDAGCSGMGRVARCARNTLRFMLGSSRTSWCVFSLPFLPWVLIRRPRSKICHLSLRIFTQPSAAIAHPLAVSGG